VRGNAEGYSDFLSISLVSHPDHRKKAQASLAMNSTHEVDPGSFESSSTDKYDSTYSHQVAELYVHISYVQFRPFCVKAPIFAIKDIVTNRNFKSA
jgi:hypothetical protein